ncbi:DUF4244 domain-containing protein [Streptomyces sp. NPDC091292]|uniref:DUF4244 domain-containing protein n=1 Tax=Streptomyces sp. NPDC091292 TaxID=3365991 RepID=UPI00381DE7E2
MGARKRVRAGAEASAGLVWEAVRAPVRWVRGRRRDAGMVTSEYAMGLLAAVGFAALLHKVLTSGQARAALQGVVEKALDVQF